MNIEDNNYYFLAKLNSGPAQVWDRWYVYKHVLLLMLLKQVIHYTTYFITELNDDLHIEVKCV